MAAVERPTPTGEFRDRITVWEPIFSTDTVTGAPLLSQHDNQGSVWAKITPLTSREQLRAKSVQLDTTHAIRVRYASATGFDAGMKVVWSDPRGTHVAEITGITEPVRRTELELAVTETTPTPPLDIPG